MERIQSNLGRTLKAIEGLIAQEQHVRPSKEAAQVQDVPLGPTASCSQCRRIKGKCIRPSTSPSISMPSTSTSGPISDESCLRCTSLGLLCERPVKLKAGRKKGVTKKLGVLQGMRDEVKASLEALNKLGLEGSVAMSTSSASETVSSDIATSIASPRTAHFLDSTPEEDPSAFGNTPTDIEASVEGEEEEEDDDEAAANVYEVIDNPLAVLAHLSVRDGQPPSIMARNASISSSICSGEDPFASGTKTPADWLEQSKRFYSGGLYQICDDLDPTLDPVNMGILTEYDITRLLDLYFTKLWGFFYHLMPELHTATFVRATSPFLTTAICACVAMFDPQSAGIVQALRDHAEYLSIRVFALQLRSIEIVHAFLFMTHWAPPSSSWSKDRSWLSVGFAIRIATSLRIDRPLSADFYLHYQRKLNTPPSERFYDLLNSNRERVWKMLFIQENALSVQTGRHFMTLNPLNLARATPAPSKPPPLSTPEYTVISNETLNRILAKSLVHFAHLCEREPFPGEDLRATFNSTWKAQIEAWLNFWPHINYFHRVLYRHVSASLLSLSLKFQGPKRVILEECQDLAMEMCQVVAEWKDTAEAQPPISYASNFAVTNMAYAATLTLKFLDAAVKTGHPKRHFREQVLSACNAVVSALLQIAAARVNSPSLASLQAARVQGLIQQFTPPSPASALLSDPSLLPDRPPSPAAPLLGSPFGYLDDSFLQLSSTAAPWTDEQGWTLPGLPALDGFDFDMSSLA